MHDFQLLAMKSPRA